MFWIIYIPHFRKKCRVNKVSQIRPSIFQHVPKGKGLNKTPQTPWLTRKCEPYYSFIIKKKVTIPFLTSSILSLLFSFMHVYLTRLFCLQIIIIKLQSRSRPTTNVLVDRHRVLVYCPNP